MNALTVQQIISVQLVLLNVENVSGVALPIKTSRLVVRFTISTEFCHFLFGL